MPNYVNIIVPESDPPVIAYHLTSFDTLEDGTIDTEIDANGVGALCRPDGTATVITIDPNTLEVGEPWLAGWEFSQGT
jgi:hypothetical protein